MSTDLAEVEDTRTLHADLRDCLPRERDFARHFIECGGNGALAAKLAGCGEVDSNSNTYARIAHRYLGRERMAKAIQYLARQEIRHLAPAAIAAVRDVVSNISPTNNHRLKAAGMILDRTDPSEQKIAVTHENKTDPLKTTLEYVAHLKSLGTPRDILIKEFGKGGLEYYESLIAASALTIDVDFTEVDPELDALIGDL
jgi:hypothetical protein